MILSLPDAAAVAERAAVDALELIQELQVEQYLVHLNITGGTVGIATVRELVSHAPEKSVDWSRVHIWWGDERFVPVDSPDRNAVQAFGVGLLTLGIPEDNIHEFPAHVPSDESDIRTQLAAAVDTFEAECLSYTDADTGMIRFDLTLLGVGPDGHVASLFPGHATPGPGHLISGEADSPKPPSQRLTFTYEALNHSERVWFTVAGKEKAQAVTGAINGSKELPVGRIAGRIDTRWYLDLEIVETL